MLRLRITSTAEWKVRSGHPWIFSDSIKSQNRHGALGELAVVYDKWDDFRDVGLLDPSSPLRCRVLHAGNPHAIDDAWWRGRLAQRLSLRQKVFAVTASGIRCIKGESDGWPVLVLERDAHTFVL